MIVLMHCGDGSKIHKYFQPVTSVVNAKGALYLLCSLPLCSLRTVTAVKNHIHGPPMLSFRDSIPIHFFNRLAVSHECPESRTYRNHLPGR